MSVRDRFLDLIQKRHPALSRQVTEPLVAENLLSPFRIELPISVLHQAQDFVKAAFSLRESQVYQNFYAEDLRHHGLQDPGNKSILMSYDFHLDPMGQLKLIEVNTNAAFLALGDLMYEASEQSRPIGDFTLKEIQDNILEELILNGKTVATPSVAIVDDQPAAQRLYLEFLVFQELFRSWGWKAEIQDIRVLSGSYDFIYNRSTDFYLESAEAQPLAERFKSRRACVSPNPYEYFLLADKQRLIDWSSPEFLQKMQIPSEQQKLFRRNLPESGDLNESTAEHIWSQRKKYFLKPKRAFGAKQSYKGASISRRLFDELLPQGMMVQEYVAAPEKIFETPSGPQSFKYDLRFYAYKDRVQSVVARLYQGQVTNLKSAYGGFACVCWN